MAYETFNCDVCGEPWLVSGDRSSICPHCDGMLGIDSTYIGQEVPAHPLPSNIGSGFAWYVRLYIPLNMSALSKNRSHIVTKSGIRKNPRTRETQKHIALQIRNEIRKRGIEPDPTGKVWVDLHVVKHKAAIDAVNVIDVVMDAIEAGIEVNDRQYAIRFLDWEIREGTENPSLVLGIGQERECNR